MKNWPVGQMNLKDKPNPEASDPIDLLQWQFPFSSESFQVKYRWLETKGR